MTAYENCQLKEENLRLKTKLKKAYDIMKQFVFEGRSLLDKFMEWMGEKVRDVWKEGKRNAAIIIYSGKRFSGL